MCLFNRAKLKKDHNLDVKFVQLDITNEASVKAAKETIEKAEGRLDTLVNNAGTNLYPCHIDSCLH